MISLTCTSCKRVLEMDDAFAGGVCRCRHCGTIQTVPSKLKNGNGSAKTRSGSKAIYAKTARGEAIPSSGLDQLAQVVASSGLSSERLRAQSVAPATPSQSRQRLMMLIGAGVVLGLGIAIGAWFAMTGQSGIRPAADSTAASGQPGRGDAAVQPPAFCGIALHEKTIVYVLDRGGATADLFSYLKEACYQSVESLGTDRRYQIIFWNNGSDDSYPATPTFAMPQSIDAARRALDSVYAHGQTDVGTALAHAVKSSPDAIVLATGKGWQLDQAFIDQVLNIRQGKPIKIHTLTLGSGPESDALKSIAQKTGGQSRLVTEGELKKFARHE
jgi:hypothetical protein